MRIFSGLGKLLIPVLLIAAPLQAKVLHLHAAQLSTGAGNLTQLQVDLDWPDGAERGTLRFRAEQLVLPAMAYQAGKIDWTCPLERAPDKSWRCGGMVRTSASAGATLSVAIATAATTAHLQIGKSSIGYESRAAAPDLSRIDLQQIPIAWLKAYLATLWAQGSWTQGTIGGRIDVAAPANAPLQVHTDLALDGINLETPDGLLAGAGLKGRMQLDFRGQTAGRHIDTTLTLRGGEFLAQSFYAVLPASPVAVHVVADGTGNGGWRLPVLSWRDGSVLVADGKATLDANAAISDLDLVLSFGDLATARDRYLSGFLAPAGFSDLLLTGKSNLDLHLRGGSLSDAAAHMDQINAVDSHGRFTFAGIDGDLRWTRQAEARISALQWGSGAIYGIGMGPARFAFGSSNGQLQLTAPVTVAMLDGNLRLDDLRWQAPAGDKGARFQFGMAMQDLNLNSLSQRLGWPPFTGSIGGKIPAAHFENNVLTLDGGLTMNVFGGSVALSDLVMERPFGVAPTLSANVAIKDIDMEPMTSVFGFGSITGRLDGHINELRLVDWSPVAFDARLETDAAWKGKRRISQRAVQNITNVGGGGLLAGLQAQVLKFFKDFGYERIGLACKLSDNTCRMDGIGSAGDGYIIVAGAGLPRIEVVGFQRRVDWPTLVSRLKAATQGQTPVIK
jgi:hypothetical protein